MKNIIITLIILSSQLANANIYECKTADSDPKLIESKPRSISFEPAKPYFVEHAENPQIHSKGSMPFLIYYAIDSKEPLMQYSVKYEIAKLKESCEKSDKVNFIAFLNSLYVEKNEFILCKQNVFSTVSFDKYYKSTGESLAAKRKFLRTGDHTGELPGMMTYLVRYKDVVNEAFYDYPLAHPDFLYDLITLATTEGTLFPSSKYVPFLNLKSHGSKNNVLSGLHKCQVDAKTRSQEKQLKDTLSPSELTLLNQDNYFNDLAEIEPLLKRIALSETDAIGSLGGQFMGGQFMGGQFMGGQFMGGQFMGGQFMGQAIAGLGNSEGLGTDFSFGTYHIALSSVLIHLFNDRNDRFLGFAMLESCDTNRNVTFHQESLEYVLGVYSANHSLWYRNLNWWNILENANGSTLKMIQQLRAITPLIRNIVVTE